MNLLNRPPTIIPDSAPFTPEQCAWLNGFLAGILAREVAQATAEPAKQSPKPITVLFGSQTGTAERLAKGAARIAGERGFTPLVLDMGCADLAKLAEGGPLLVITSTYGDGDPPDNAKVLFAQLAEAREDFSRVQFSVCGLGDSNYSHFCQAAKDIDAHLERLGAVRIAPRTDCDVDFEKSFQGWLETAIGALGAGMDNEKPLAVTLRDARAPSQETPGAVEYGRSNPFLAPLEVSRVLNGEGSDKEVRHIEISLRGSGLRYEAGDALGVMPQNSPEIVQEVLHSTRCDGEEEVHLADGSKLSFRKALTRRCDLGKPTAELTSRLAGPSGTVPVSSEAPVHVIDLLRRRQETRLGADELVRLLRPLAPRLYSISSSPQAHEDSVHLTVGVVRYQAHGRGRKGVCSTFLADSAVPGETLVPVFIQVNGAFRLPREPQTPIIMIGPGTGIAPFRAFLHERRASGAKGKCWLFFGDRHAATDFLYGDELAGFQREGVLTQLDTAFSRDQEEKIYVQHRLEQRAIELYDWLEQGAHVYVCGDAIRMAKDVDIALHRVVETAGGKSPEQAREYVQALRSGKRYLRDVY
jgi:sulfite reductase (NADPH) flavoprotein alpha-component